MILTMAKYHENLLKDCTLSLLFIVQFFSPLEIKIILKRSNETFLRIIRYLAEKKTIQQTLKGSKKGRHREDMFWRKREEWERTRQNKGQEKRANRLVGWLASLLVGCCWTCLKGISRKFSYHCLSPIARDLFCLVQMVRPSLSQTVALLRRFITTMCWYYPSFFFHRREFPTGSLTVNCLPGFERGIPLGISRFHRRPKVSCLYDTVRPFARWGGYPFQGFGSDRPYPI